MFAFWATPDVQTQTRHFGKVLLDDSDLARYCLWYHGLSKPEVAQWDKFVDTLKPGKELVGCLEEFTFQREGSHNGPSTDLADGVKEMLITGLTGKKWVRPRSTTDPGVR